MKKNLVIKSLIFVSLLLVLGPACHKEEENKPGFDMQYQTQFDIPAGLGPFVVHHFYIKNIPTRYLQLLNQYGKTGADISGIVTTQAALSGVFGDADFSFVDKVSLRVFKNDDPTDFIEAAYREPVPLDPGNALPLIPSLADSKPIIEQASFGIDLALTLRKTTQEITNTHLDLYFKAIYN